MLYFKKNEQKQRILQCEVVRYVSHVTTAVLPQVTTRERFYNTINSSLSAQERKHPINGTQEINQALYVLR